MNLNEQMTRLTGGLCHKAVSSGVVHYQCRLDDGHDGPCASPEVGVSMVVRTNWEREQARRESPVAAQREFERERDAHEGQFARARASVKSAPSEHAEKSMAGDIRVDEQGIAWVFDGAGEWKALRWLLDRAKEEGLLS